jgi:hypothetical protein
MALRIDPGTWILPQTAAAVDMPTEEPYLIGFGCLATRLLRNPQSAWPPGCWPGSPTSPYCMYPVEPSSSVTSPAFLLLVLIDARAYKYMRACVCVCAFLSVSLSVCSSLRVSLSVCLGFFDF